MEITDKDALQIERRRVQNRIAQRRYRQKQNPLQSQENIPLEWVETQEDAYNSTCLDIQSQDISPDGSTCFSPGSFTSSSIESDASYFSTPTSQGSFIATEQTPESIFTGNEIQQSLLTAERNTCISRGSHALLSTSSPSIGSLSNTSPEEFPSGWLSPLHIAAQKGHERIARILLQHNTDCNERDSDGLTPILHAIAGGHEDVMQLLLLHGAHICEIDSQQRRSALHWAVLHRRENLLRTLLYHCLGERALIDSYDDLGKTPLHVAIDINFEEGVLLLLRFGANLLYRARKD